MPPKWPHNDCYPRRRLGDGFGNLGNSVRAPWRPPLQSRELPGWTWGCPRRQGMWSCSSFWSLNKNQEWHLTLNSVQSKDKMLLAGYVIAKGKNFKVRSSDNRQFTAKIHWAPPFAPNTAMVKALDPYGEVKSIGFKKCKSQGFESVCSGIPSIVMTGDRRKVPHLITVTNPVTVEPVL